MMTHHACGRLGNERTSDGTRPKELARIAVKILLIVKNNNKLQKPVYRLTGHIAQCSNDFLILLKNKIGLFSLIVKKLFYLF